MIALFDSGYGGLTVFKPIIERLPQYDYLYLGDNARAPYGGHSKENIIQFSKDAVDYLFEQGAVLILFACHTASTVSLRAIQQEYLRDTGRNDRKILGVTIPLVEAAVSSSPRNNFSIVGTKATIKHQGFEIEIKKLKPQAKINSQACPLLVPFIEENWHHKPEAKSILKKYLMKLKSCNPDTLILGCTHYPLMLKEFKKYMGSKTKIIHSDVVAQSLEDYLSRHPEIESKITRNKSIDFQTTDDADEFTAFLSNNFNFKHSKVKRVEI